MLFEPLNLVCPPLDHRYPLVPVFPARVCGTNFVALQMSELAFDRVGVPVTDSFRGRRDRISEHAADRGPEAARRLVPSADLNGPQDV